MQVNLSLIWSQMAGHDLKYNFLANQAATHVVTWIKGPTRARNPTCQKFKHVAKAKGAHLEASWPKAVARDGTHQSADQGGRPTGGPHHRPPALASRFQEASLRRFGVSHLLQLDREDPYAPPYKYEREGQNRTHTSHTPPLIVHLELRSSSQELRQPRRSREIGRE